ncbi:MAG: branched-chain amino acid transport system II carrier protein [Candidatus Berkiella sp.]
MSQYKSIFLYGFAIFAMFFGSGNLVFPISIGNHSGNSWAIGFVGLFLSGILLPFLGLFVIKLHKGDYNQFFGEAGGIARIALPLFILSLLGAFGVVPRCITVAHGGISYVFPELSLVIFAAIFCLVTFFFCLKDDVMINVLGKWMSPILLIVLLGLIAMGIIKAPSNIEDISASHAFIDGFLTGYQTMDLFAALFFSALIFKQMQSLMPATATDREILKFAIKPSIIGSIMLSIVYLGFVFLGAHYSHLISSIEPEQMLPTIVMHVMGDFATLFVAIAMLLSCITTAVALNNIYARYLCNLFKCKDSRFPIILFATTFISFLISLLDFKGIAAFLAPALEVSYPGLIVLTVFSICTRKYHKPKMYLFWMITVCSAVYIMFKHGVL